MPLPLTGLASVTSRLVLSFWYRLTRGSPGQRAVKCVCVIAPGAARRYSPTDGSLTVAAVLRPSTDGSAVRT